MSTFTEHYNFIKPGEGDFYDIQDMNENMDTLDGLLAENEAATENINEKIGTAEDTGTGTVFGKLNQLSSGSKTGLTAIKSIQHIFYTPPGNTTSGSIEIEAVDPSKCIVIFERLKEYINSSLPALKYTLHENSLTFTFANLASGSIREYGFWIIEFN